MSHKWQQIEGAVEWCSQCGTTRGPLSQRFDPTTGEAKGWFYTYFEVGSEPRDVPENEGARGCPLLPRYYREAIYRWLEMRETWGYAEGTSAMGFSADADHSSLLRRILAGQTVTEEPPPLSHSYPNVGLLERGWGEPMSVWLASKHESKPNGLFGYPAVVIDQHPWQLLEKLGDEDFVVSYRIPDKEAIQKDRVAGKSKKPGTGQGRTPREVLSKTRWRVYRIGTRVYFHKGKRIETAEDQRALDQLWRLERLPDAEP